MHILYTRYSDLCQHHALYVMQECPETPELRTAVVSVNFKLRQAKSSEERWQKLAYTLNESPTRYESRSYSTSTTLLFTHSIPTLQSKEEEHEQPRG